MTHKGRQDLVVVWRVYEPCQLACGFCGYSRTIERPRHVADLDQVLAFGGMTIQAAQRYLERIALSTRGEPWPIADCQPAA